MIDWLTYIRLGLCDTLPKLLGKVLGFRVLQLNDGNALKQDFVVFNFLSVKLLKWEIKHK